jgi:tRNA (cmo5U34)-methyltransferase
MTRGPPHLPGDYDAQIVRTIPYYGQFIEETINVLLSLDREPSLWLDTGCGTGTVVRAALDIFPRTRFILADPSEKMLVQAKGKLDGQERVRFLGPSGSQDLRDQATGRPDVITAIQCHHYLSKDERRKAVGACFDLLSDGGIYITFENVRPLTSAGVRIGKRNWGRYQRAMGKGQSEVDAHLARFDNEYFPITVEEHLELYRKAGFSAVELFWFSYMQGGFYCLK